MIILKKLMGDIEVTRDLMFLLIIGGLYSLGVALSNTFVNVYLWKQSGQFVDLAVYNLSSVVLQPITFILAGKLAKKVDRVIVLRLGVIFLSIFYSTVLLLGDSASHLLVLLGALLGTGFGFYWLAFNVLTFEITEPDTRDFFNGFMGLLGSFAGMIGPFFAGWVITSMDKSIGYKTIFGISLALFFASVVISFLLKPRPADGKFMFVKIIKERRNNPNWAKILKAHFFQGLREGTFVFVIVVWVFITTKSEFALGTFTLVQSSVSFIAYFLATRLIKPQFRKKAILMGGTILFLALGFILFELTFTLLIIYGVIVAVAYPLILVPFASLSYDVIGHGWKAGEMRIEYIVVRELFLNLGRIVSILLFIGTVTFFDQEKSIPFLLPIIGVGHLLIYFCVKGIHFEPKKSFGTIFTHEKRE